MNTITMEMKNTPSFVHGWSERQLQDVAWLVNGRGFKPFEWNSSGLPIIRIQNLNGSDDFNYYSGRYDSKIEVNTGQLLFAWSGSRGTSFGPHIWNGPTGVLNYHTWKVRVNENEIISRFLFHVLRHLTRIIEDQAHGASALVHVQKWEMEKFPFQCPDDLREQEAIAEALSDADALIEGLERLIAKKRLIKQGAMQELLTGRRRLPGFSGRWEVKRLAEIGQVKTGLTYNPENVSPYGTLVLRSSNIQNDRLAFADNVFVDLDVSDEATVQAGDLLICVRNGSRQLIGKTAMIDKRADGMAFGAFMSAYRSDLNDYLIWCFQSSIIQKQVAEHLGATINQITNKTLKAIEVPISTDAQERTAVSTVLRDMDAEIRALEIRLEKARQIKEGMMQNLLTGRIRLV
jgi:type I restriction enzyme S subunit